MSKELLLKVNAWVQEEHAKYQRGEKSEWDQTTWACGTGCCFAGKVVQESGFKLIDQGRYFLCQSDGCEPASIENTALEILNPNGNFDMADALDALFSGGNRAEDIDDLVHEIIAEHCES